MNDSSQVFFNSFEPIGNSNNNNPNISQSQNQNSKVNFSGEKIKLEFSIKNCKTGTYSLQAKLYDNQAIDYNSEEKEHYFGGDLAFDKFLLCDFLPEKQQELLITVNKRNHPIDIKTTLKKVIDSPNLIASFSIGGNEYLIIRAQKMGKLDEVLNIKFTLKNEENLNYFKNHKIKFVISNNNNKLFSSSPILDNGTFESTNIPLYLLKPSYNVCFYDSNDKLVGIYEKTLEFKDEKSQFTFTMSDGAEIDFYDHSEITKNFSFIDYKNAGVKIALSIGIDFTVNNGHYADEDSLHYLKPNELNDYEKAIATCGKIVGEFDYDQIFPVYGFGAIINSSKKKKTSDCFNINFSENPDIYGIDNVLKIYRECIEKEKLQFSCKAKFAPLLNEIKSKMKDDIFEYHILMILTTGRIDDLKETKDFLVEASMLPLSVIIVGIGKDDFSKMIELDGDEKPIESSSGKVRKRDIVQFVPFYKFQNDDNLLFMEVLAEIPKQIIEYYQFKDLNPEKIKSKLRSQKILSVNPKDKVINSLKQEKNININSVNSSINTHNNNGSINTINNSHINIPNNSQMTIPINSQINSTINSGVNNPISSQINNPNNYQYNNNGSIFTNPFVSDINPNPYVSNNTNINNGSYYNNSLSYGYSQSVTNINSTINETMPNQLNQIPMYNSTSNQQNMRNISITEYNDSFNSLFVSQVDDGHNSSNITNNNISNNFIINNIISNNNNISNNNLTNSNITNNNLNNSHITNNNITNSNISNNNENNNLAEFDFNALPVHQTVYIPKNDN